MRVEISPVDLLCIAEGQLRVSSICLVKNRQRFLRRPGEEGAIVDLAVVGLRCDGTVGPSLHTAVDDLDELALNVVGVPPQSKELRLHKGSEPFVLEQLRSSCEVIETDDIQAEWFHLARSRLTVFPLGDEEGAVLEIQVPHPTDHLEQIGESPLPSLDFNQPLHGLLRRMIGDEDVEFEEVSRIGLDDLLLHEVSRCLEQGGDVVFELLAGPGDIRQRYDLLAHQEPSLRPPR